MSQPFINHSQGPIGLTALANILHGLYDLEGSEEGIKVQSSFAVRLLSWSSLAQLGLRNLLATLEPLFKWLQGLNDRQPTTTQMGVVQL